MEDQEKQEERPQYLKFEWRQNDLYDAILDMDQARELFGLGGTPDDQMFHKVKALLTAMPAMQVPVREQGDFAEGGAPGAMRVRQLEGK